MIDRRAGIALVLMLAGLLTGRARGMDRIAVSEDHRGFVRAPSGRPFTPFGFNYDRDAKSRLIEDYWEAEWPTVEADFREMKGLGANVVRVHLQFGKFFDAPDRPNAKNLDRLGKLLELAEREGLYLDLTGLGCYHKKDVPAWYDALDEPGRWSAQARFWEEVAGRCAGSPAVFCYDLMNEPVVPGGQRKAGDWLGPPLGDKHYVQCLTLDQKDRPRPEIAREWVHALVGAIRKHDRKALVTVGLVPWSLDRPGLMFSGVDPRKIVDDLDFIAVHLYPDRSKPGEAIETLRGFAVGKPVVIEEIFPMNCSADELGKFIDQSKGIAAGWIGFYWGQTPDELRDPKSIGDAMTRDWLNLFQRRAPEFSR